MDNQSGRTLSDLDDCDLQIVRLLQENGRRSNSAIARGIGVSEPTVRKRIDRLIQDRIIKVAAVFDPRRTGYSTNALIGIRTHVGRVQEVGERLAQFNDVVYVGYITGRYDLLIEVMLKDDDQVFDFLTRRLRDYPGIATTETFHVLRTAKINYDWKLPDEVFERVRNQPSREKPQESA